MIITTATATPSDTNMRYQHLVLELGQLLARLRFLGASYEDCRRANDLVDTVTPDNIGAVIHDIQGQISDLEHATGQDCDRTEIDKLREMFDKIEFEDWIGR